MLKKVATTIFVLASMVLVGCAGMGPKQTAGTVIGGGLGGVAGSQIGSGSGRIVGASVGTLLGAMFGGYVGQQMDQTDEMMAKRNAQNVLENGRDGYSREWVNPNTARWGDSTVLNTRSGPGGPCRTLSSVAYDDFGNVMGREQVLYCRQANGTWAPVR
jgi:surface antigen